MTRSALRNLRGRDLAVALVVVLCVCTLVFVWVITRQGGGQGESETNPKPSATSPSIASEDPSELAQDREALKDRVTAFAETYFSQSTQVPIEDLKQAVQPYATEHFMQTAKFGFDESSNADLAMVDEGASLEATVRSGFDGEFIDAATAQGSVKLQITKRDHDGEVVNSFIYTQQMVWVKQDGTWLVYETSST